MRVVRDGRSPATPLVVASLLIAAALVLGVGQVKRASIAHAYRHTNYVAASVVGVGANRIASVRYLWAGHTRTGLLNVSTASGVDPGDRIALRVSDSGGRLQLETPFYSAVYPWTAAALALMAVAIVIVSRWPSDSSGRRKRLLPAELSSPHRRYHDR
jgi:hypothetical protein